MTTSDNQPAAEDEQLVLLWESHGCGSWVSSPTGDFVDGVEGVSDQMRDWLIARLIRHATETTSTPANVKVTLAVAFGDGEWTPNTVPERCTPVCSSLHKWRWADELEVSLRWERPWLRQLGQQPPPHGAKGVEGVRATMCDWVASRLIRRFEHTVWAMPDSVTVTMAVELDPPEWAAEGVPPMPLGTAGR